MVRAETLSSKLLSWTHSRKCRVPKTFLTRYAREQSFQPGEPARQKIAKTNPETHMRLLLKQLAMVEEYIDEVATTDLSLFTRTEADTILSVLNTLPLLTQHFMSSVTLRTNTATRHCNSFHNERRRIDKGQRGNVCKRAVWRYKAARGKDLPRHAGLWELGHISRRACKGSVRMNRLVSRFMRDGEKVKKLSGKCAYWFMKMGVEEDRAAKLFYDFEKKEWEPREPPVFTAPESTGLENNNADVEGKAEDPSRSRRHDLPTSRSEAEEPQYSYKASDFRTAAPTREGHIAPEQYESPPGSQERAQHDRASRNTSEQSELEFPSTQLTPISEIREEEDAAEKSYLLSKANTVSAHVHPSPATAQPATPAPSPAPRQPDERPSTPDYERRYFHPRLTDSQVALFYTERVKANVNREQLWNPPPRYLDPDSRRMCMDNDSKWRVRTPRSDERKVIECRRREYEQRKREAREKYEKETPLLRQWRDRWRERRELRRREANGEKEEDEEWPDEKSAAYASAVSRTRQFGERTAAAGREAAVAQASQGQNTPDTTPSTGSPSTSESGIKDPATPSVQVPQKGIRVHRRILIRRCRLVRPFQPGTNTTVRTTNTKTTDTTQTTKAEESRSKSYKLQRTRSLFIRKRTRPRFSRPTPIQEEERPMTFNPSEVYMKRLQKSSQRLVKQARRTFMRSYNKAARYMDIWERTVDSGQAWSLGKERLLPGFAEGTRCIGEN